MIKPRFISPNRNISTWFALNQQRRRRRNAVAATNPVLPNVPNDCLLRLQASMLQLGDDDSIASWPDLSDNGNDAWQDAVSQQPTFATVTFAGKTFGVARFDTSDDGMQTPVFISDAFSIFTLWRLADPTVSDGALLSSGSLDWSIGNIDGQMLCFFEGWSAVAPVNNSDFYLVEARVVPGSSPLNIYLNGMQVGRSDGASSAPQNMMLGACGSNGYPGNCDCAEIIIYDRFLSDDETAGVRAYFQEQYNYLKL